MSIAEVVINYSTGESNFSLIQDKSSDAIRHLRSQTPPPPPSPSCGVHETRLALNRPSQSSSTGRV